MLLFEPYIEKGEISNLSVSNFYCRITSVDTQEPMSGVTVVVEDKGSAEIAKRVVQSSRMLYAKKPEELPMEQLAKPTKEKRLERKPGKNHLTKKAGEELSGISSVR